ncbi:MAG: response regulator [Desulfobacterales bacterium]|nr:response regulator [Desulfobacterales bacterium]MBF0395374.1 response regulator [Desulfobacterales bacterium]
MSKKVLAIDDEQIVLDSIKKILIPEGFLVDVTLESRVGIYKAIYEQYDIVLTDIKMPDSDGIKVLQDIRKFKADLPVVIITGYATVNSAIQAMKIGANNYIEKPFTPEQLIETVKGALDISK